MGSLGRITLGAAVMALGLAAAASQGRAQATAPETRATRKPAAQKSSPASEQRRRTLEAVKSWGYQLRSIRFPEIAASPLDLVVIDHALSAGRRFVHQFAPELVEMAQGRPGGGRRIVLAYLSIGEAERYRFYWEQDWYEPATKPRWLGEMNTVWDGNYLVRFWDPEWQRIVLEGPDSYLGRILAAGFDGVYLDRADVHAEWQPERPSAEQDMAAFIAKLAAAARARNPGFLIVMQNAEELAVHRSVREAIDGIAKEDLYFGVDHKATPNDAATVQGSLQHLRLARRSGRRILVVEYLDEAEKVRAARRRAEAEGFLLHITSRDLGGLTLVAPDQEAAEQAKQPVTSGPVRRR